MAKKKIMTLDELAREARRNYFAQWRKNNPEKVKQHNTTYWTRLAAKLKQQGEAVFNDTKTDD